MDPITSGSFRFSIPAATLPPSPRGARSSGMPFIPQIQRPSGYLLLQGPRARFSHLSAGNRLQVCSSLKRPLTHTSYDLLGRHSLERRLALYATARPIQLSSEEERSQLPLLRKRKLPSDFVQGSKALEPSPKRICVPPNGDTVRKTILNLNRCSDTPKSVETRECQPGEGYQMTSSLAPRARAKTHSARGKEVETYSTYRHKTTYASQNANDRDPVDDTLPPQSASEQDGILGVQPNGTVGNQADHDTSRQMSRVSAAPAVFTATLPGARFCNAYVVFLITLISIWLCYCLSVCFEAIDYRVVDWSSRAMRIEVALASIPQEVLFGSSQVRENVSSLSNSSDLILQPVWTTSSSKFVPWETTSTGVYVPESVFLTELDLITRTACADLLTTAQFASGCFSVPDVSELCGNIWLDINNVIMLHQDMTSLLPKTYSSIAELRILVQLLNLSMLIMHNAQDSAMGSEPEGWDMGSDTARLQWLFTQHPYQWQPLAGLLDMPRDEPRPLREANNLKRRWQNLKARWSYKPVTSSTSSYDSTRVPSPGQYVQAQATNGTSEFLLKHFLGPVLRRIILDTDDSSNAKQADFTYDSFVAYAKVLSQVHRSIDKLNKQILLFTQEIGDITSLLYCVPELKRHWVKRSIERLFDVVEFLDAIATNRVRDMDSRAMQAMAILSHSKQQQQTLARDIKQLREAGWIVKKRRWLISHTFLYHFPDFIELLVSWSSARDLIISRAYDIYQQQRDRESEFWSRHENPPDDLPAEQEQDWRAWNLETIYSRWGMGDIRQYPEGNESFCWLSEERFGEREDSSKELQMRQSKLERLLDWISMLGPESSYRAPTRCGNSSMRHGSEGRVPRPSLSV